MISTKVHGILDYSVAFLLIVPWIMKYRGDAWLVPSLAGLAILIYSMMTNYELGMMKLISMRTHLMLDVAIGILLAASPWVFGFAERINLPHLAAGLLEIVVALLTRHASAAYKHPPVFTPPAGVRKVTNY